MRGWKLLLLACLVSFLALSPKQRRAVEVLIPAAPTNVHVGPTPTVDEWNPGPVANEADYWTMMETASALLYTKLSGYTHPADDDNGLTHVYYDAELGQYRLADHFADTTTYYPRADAASLWYLDYYVLANNGQVPGYRNFAEGIAERYIRQGDADAKTAIEELLANGAYVNSSPGEDMEDISCGGTCTLLNRETAYALDLFIEAPRVGITLTPTQITRRDTLKAYALSHLDQWAVSQTADYLRPFMAAITIRSVIRYDTVIAPDAAITSAVIATADYMWANCWDDTAKAFRYTDRDLSLTSHPDADPEDLNPQPDLNALIFPVYAWLWMQTGTAKWWQEANEIFQGGIPVYSGASHVSGADIGALTAEGLHGKQYNQQLFWQPDGLAWMAARGAGATPTPTPPPADLDGDLTTLAPELWLDPDYTDSVTMVSTKVSQIDSRTGSISFAQGTDGLRPTIAQVNSVDCLHFDGSDDTMTSATVDSSIFAAQNKTVLAVVAISSDERFLYDSWGDWYLRKNGANCDVGLYDGSNDNVSQACSANDPHVLKFTHTGGNAILCVDGTCSAPVASGDTAFGGSLILGAPGLGADLCYLVAWDSQPDSTTLAAVHQALCDKFGVTCS